MSGPDSPSIQILPHLSVVLLGHVDCGKSTLLGRLLLLLNPDRFPEVQIDRIFRDADERGRGSFRYMMLISRVRDEIDRAITIVPHFHPLWLPRTNPNQPGAPFRRLVTQSSAATRPDLTLIDVPGHRDFVKSTVCGISCAQAGLLVIDASQGAFEAGISMGGNWGGIGQTRSQPQDARILGVRDWVIVVNKMDAHSVDFSKARFDSICEELRGIFRRLGLPRKRPKIVDWKKKKTNRSGRRRGAVCFDPCFVFGQEEEKETNTDDSWLFVPVSAWTGDNLVERSENMPWYKGPTLIEAIRTLRLPAFATGERLKEKALRFSVVRSFFRTWSTVTTTEEKVNSVVVIGCVQSGILRQNDEIVISPSMVRGRVIRVEEFGKEISEALPGECVGVQIQLFDVAGFPGRKKKNLRQIVGRGFVLGHSRPSLGLPRQIQSFEAKVEVFWHPNSIRKGYSPILRIGTASVRCRIADIRHTFDRVTGKTREMAPDHIKRRDQALVVFQPMKPLHVDCGVKGKQCQSVQSRLSHVFGSSLSSPPSSVPGTKLGRFVCYDLHRMVVAGVITRVIFCEEAPGDQSDAGVDSFVDDVFEEENEEGGEESEGEDG